MPNLFDNNKTDSTNHQVNAVIDVERGSKFYSFPPHLTASNDLLIQPSIAKFESNQNIFDEEAELKLKYF